MKLVLLLMIVLDLMVLRKLLDVKETPIPTDKVVYINCRPCRPAVTDLDFPQEEEPSVEDLKEELRIKFLERRKAWEEANIWNKEDNLRIFRRKNGLLEEEEEGYNKKEDYNRGLFSLSAI